MKKLVLGALGAALVAGLLVLVWQLRDVPEEEPPAPPPASAKAPARASEPGRGGSAAMSAPTFADDEDPAGNLRLEGQVLGEGDLPLGGARVTINATPRRSATTEQDGSFAFDALVGRTYRISARAGALTGGPVMHKLTATSEPVVVRLRQGATLRVTVLSAGDGEPLAGARVKLRTADRQAGITDAEGQLEFQGLGEGRLVVTAVAEGHAAGRKMMLIPREPAAPISARLSLRAGVPVSGRVVDVAGAPVARAKVSPRDLADLHGRAARRWLEPARTDAAGRFTIAALAPGSYRLVAWHKEHAQGSSKPVVVGQSPVSKVQIQLPAGAELAGTVVTPGGEPVPWASVRVGPEVPGRGAGQRHRRATADSAGAFRLKGLSRAKVAVAASAQRGSSAISTVDLAARPKVEDLRLTLSQQGVIAGTVQDEAGEPLPEVQVSAMPDVFGRGAIRRLYMGGLGAQQTDSGGRFKFTGLPDGKYRLRASRSGMTRRMYKLDRGTEARPGDMAVKLELPSPGGVSGRVQDPQGRPVTTFTVTVGEPPGTPVIHKEGRFKVGSIPPGEHDVTVRSAAQAALVREGVKVTAGKVTDLGALTLERGRVVSGRVLDSEGRPAAGATVVVGKKIIGDGKQLVADLGRSFEESSGLRRGTSGDDGAYSVAGIGKGPLLMVADHAQAGRSPAVAVPPGEEDARMDLRLKPTGGLQGTVYYGDKPAPGVVVVATQKGTRDQTVLATTDSEGQYLMERLAAGSYDLMAMSKTGLGGKSGGAVATVEPGRKATVDIKVEAGDVTLQVQVKGLGGVVIPLSQVFLFKGGLSPSTGKQVQEAFLGEAKGGGAMMGFAKDGQGAQFKQVVPAAYSVCVLPINGDIHDASFRTRLQKHADKLRVYCKPYTVQGTPAKQSYTATVPQMTPLPEDAPAQDPAK